MPDRQRETERQKVRNHLPEEMVTLQSLLLHSPLGVLGTHAHVPGVSFKPPSPGREPQTAMWQSSDIAITLTAGSHREVFAIGRVRSPDRDIETESKKSPPRGDGHAAIPSSPFSSRGLGHARTRARCEF